MSYLYIIIDKENHDLGSIFPNKNLALQIIPTDVSRPMIGGRLPSVGPSSIDRPGRGQIDRKTSFSSAF